MVLLDIPNAEEFSLQIEGTERWLESQKTLQENFVKEDDVLVLARKFWFSDANVSVDSPKELHLLFVQAKGMVIRGFLPTSRDQAIDLAALGLQIRHGNFDPERTKKKGWLEPEEFLAKQWYKSKKKMVDLEKDIAKEWKRKVGLNEANAKYRYLQTCRSLPTWGITHWRVEEKVQVKKNVPPKWVFIRVGITRKSFLVMDDKTYEVLKEWPIHKIKRWSASDVGFTLDLGDWEDEYLVCRTRKGGEIAQQLAGYIDIILKQKRQAPNLRTEDDAQIGKVTNVAVTRGHAGKARTAVTAQGNDMRSVDGSMGDGEQNYGLIPGQGPNQFGIPGLGQELVDGMGISGAAHVTDLDSAIFGIDGFIAALGSPLSSAALPQQMTVQDLRQRYVESVTSAQRAALGLMDAAGKGALNKAQIDAEAKKIAYDLGAIVAAAKLAAASADQDVSLLPGAYAISEAISKVLQVSRDLANGVETDPQMALWMSQQAMKAAEMCMACAQQGYLSDVASKDLIMSSALCVAEASNALRQMGDEYAGADLNLLRASKNVGSLGDHTLFTAKALSSTMIHPHAQKMVEDSITQLHSACGGMLAKHKEAGQDGSIINKLALAARGVSDSMSQLLAATKQASLVTDDFSDLVGQGDLLKQHCSVLMSQSAQSQEILAAYKALASSATRMTSQAKALAARSPDDLKNKLVNAARSLAQQTGSLFQQVKATANDPKDYNNQAQLKQEAGLLQAIAEEMVNECSRQAAVMTLRHCAKISAASGMSLASKARLVPVNDDGTRQNMLQCADSAAKAISKLVGSINSSTNDPLSAATQAALIGDSKAVAGTEAALFACVKRSGNAVTDLSKKTDLLSCADMLQKAMKDLLSACDACEEFAGGKESKEAMQGMEALQADLDAVEMAISTGSGIASAHPGVPVTQLAFLLEEQCRVFQMAKDALQQTARTNPDLIGQATLQYQSKLADFVDVAKSMIAGERDKKVQRQILSEAKQLTGDGATHIGSAKRVSVSPNDEAIARAMYDLGAKVHSESEALLGIAKGVDLSIVDNSIKTIAASAQKTKTDFQPDKEFTSYRGDVLEQMESLGLAVENVASAAKDNIRALAKVVPVLTHVVDELITGVSGAAATAKDPESKPELLRAVVQVATGVVYTLQAVKTVANGGDASGLEKARERVNNASGALLDAISPGKAALEDAMMRLQKALANLSSGAATSYTKTPLQDISEGARAVSNATSTLLTVVLDDPTQFSRAARDIAAGTEEIINSSQVAVDPSATEHTFAAKKMFTDCDVLRDSTDFTKIAAAARNIGHASNEIAVNVANDKSAEGTKLRPPAKKVAAAALDVYRQVQGVARNVPNARENMQVSAAKLRAALEEFLNVSSSTRKKSVDPKLANNLTTSTRGVAEATESLLAKSLFTSNNPKDNIALNELYQSANVLSKGIQELLTTISAMAPGAQETAKATEQVQSSIQKLQVMSLSAVGGRLQRCNEPKQVCQEQVIEQARALAENVTKLVKNTLEEQDQIGQSTLEVASNLASLVGATTNLAGTSSVGQQQAATIDMSKGAADSVLKVMYAVKSAAANPFDNDALEELSNSSQTVRNAVSEIVIGLQGSHVALQECDQAIEDVKGAANNISPKADRNIPYHQSRKNINTKTIELVTALSHLSQLAQNNPDQVGMASRDVAALAAPIANHVSLASGTTADPNTRAVLVSAAKDVFAQTVQALELSKQLAGDRDNQEFQQKLSSTMNNVTSKIMKLQDTVKQGDVSEKAMDEAIKSIRACTSQLESAVLMSSAGQFEVKLDENKTIADYHGDLVRSSKAMKLACVELFASANRPIDQVSAAAKSVAKDMENITEVSQKNAGMLSDNFSQQAVIHGTKAIAIACQQLILAAKDVSDRPNDPKAEKSLGTANKAADEAVSQLIEIASQASAEIVENIKKVDAAKVKITNGYGEFSKGSFTGNQKATPENIIISARQVAKSSAQVVSSISSSSEMVMEAVGDIADANIALFSDSRGCTRLTNDKEVSSALQLAVRDVAQVSIALLDSVKQHRGDRPETQKGVSDMSNRLADSIMQLVDATRKLPGAEDLELDENDLESVALKELDAASRKITAATQRLLAMQTPREGVDIDTHNIHAALIDAAHAVGQAAKVLIESATAAQKELIAQGRTSKTPSPYRKDPAWAQGLISAAHEVAGTVEDLVMSSNKAVEGDGGEEGVVAAVRMVGGATARLVNASRVKVDSGSRSQQRLESAAKTVTKCTRDLAEAAKLATAHKSDVQMEKSFKTFAGKRAWELQAQTEIAKLEMELEGARRRMFKTRKDEYKR